MAKPAKPVATMTLTELFDEVRANGWVCSLQCGEYEECGPVTSSQTFEAYVNVPRVWLADDGKTVEFWDWDEADQSDGRSETDPLDALQAAVAGARTAWAAQLEWAHDEWEQRDQ